MRREKRGFWIAFCAVFFYPIGWLTGRGRYEGREHIPATGGALIVANHISHLDPIFSGLIVERSGRVPRFLAKHSLWSVPVLGQALRGSGQIPVYRESADAQQSLRDGSYTNAAQNQFIASLVAAYQPGLSVAYDRCGYACSDHASWTARGFAASSCAGGPSAASRSGG